MINEMNGNTNRCLATFVSSVCSPYTDYPKGKRVKQVHTARTGPNRTTMQSAVQRASTGRGEPQNI